ncbi:HesA/MoeB/ThiF family protein [Allomuricauda sp. d1]|uniref:HesA/MoeB/ThiF family protein n=1 Tax=Allomuricauda sp. d1 TaxID=3136725 RepID=UPI0031DCAC15
MSQKQRYIRQTGLTRFGPEGQKKLENGSVLIVGLGGLGIPAAQYLNSMGVGTLGLVEQDAVELHNLQRQVLYDEKDVGRPKLEAALEKLRQQNTETNFKTFDTFLTKDNALNIIKGFDLVVDATDNFATRYLINDACVILKKPFVYGALHGFEGQVAVFNQQDGPTYRCLFPNPPDSDEIPNCDENGVLGVLPGIVGTLQALEAVKVLTGVGEVLSGKLLLYDGLIQSTQKINLKAIPENKNTTKLNTSYDVSECTTIHSVTADEFIFHHGKGELQLIDVRTEREFKNHHLDGANNIPLRELESSLERINFNMPVYLICQSGQRSKIAFEKLRKHHPEAILFNVSGGMANLSLHVGTD